MRDDEYPTPVSDPEAEGLPDTADDDSTANDDVLTGREADGPEPAQLPGDRTPVAVDQFGTTAEEQLDGESLDYKLQREQLLSAYTSLTELTTWHRLELACWLFDYVRDDVLDATRRQQQPFSYGSLPGSEDYYFRAATARRR